MYPFFTHTKKETKQDKISLSRNSPAALDSPVAQFVPTAALKSFPKFYGDSRGGVCIFLRVLFQKRTTPPLTRNSEQSLRTQQTPDVKKKFKNVFVWFVGFLYRSKNVFLTSGVCWETGNPHPNKSTILLPPPLYKKS